MERSSLGRNAKLISFSAFFSDMGYQGVILGLPLFIVLILHAPVYYYGIAEAINYGGGSLLAYMGGRFASRYGSKKIAIIGNALIPILSFTGFAVTVPQAIALFAGGWWSRNFRTPARRTMMSESVNEENRARAYGLLHGLDVGGGIIATLIFILMIQSGYSFKITFLISAAPIVIATLLLLGVRKQPSASLPKTHAGKEKGPFFRGVLIASAIFGFGYYSMGFLILTVAVTSHRIVLGALTYTIFLAVSAMAGFIMTRIKLRKEALPLGILGYTLAGIGALLYAISIFRGFPIWVFYLSTAVIGLGTGFTEVLEPTIISKVSSNVGKGMGWLTASRSAGLFAANIVMGFLYFINPAYSYLYAFVLGVSAGIIVIVEGRKYDRDLVMNFEGS